MKIVEYVAPNGKSPFGKWFDALDAQAAAKVTVALVRIEQGNLSSIKSVSGSVLEYRIDFGPGYRLYFGRDGEEIVILLAGGTKRRQQDDIKVALERWQDYKKRKRNG
jgi:putative addiction module killer protein